MAFDSKGLDDYVDVAQRIADFRERYPNGSLQPFDPARPWEQAVVNGVSKDGKPYAMTMIVYVAAAYRTPDDQRPGIGMAWEPFPGRTPYTLGSELMNAETSAWGRAIIAALASDSKRGVSSREEVRNRQAEREPQSAKETAGANGHAAKKPMHPAQKIAMYLKRCGVTDDADRLIKVSILAERTDPIASSKELSDETLNRIADELSSCRNPAQLEALLRSKAPAS